MGTTQKEDMVAEFFIKLGEFGQIKEPLALAKAYVAIEQQVNQIYDAGYNLGLEHGRKKWIILN